jgi:ABC-type uncharacterized transport system substrate-binding protein
MKRREFFALAGGAAITWPFRAHAQQTRDPVIGLATAGSLASLQRAIAAFKDGLKDLDFIEGHNLTVEYRSTDGQLDRYPTLLADLIDKRVSLIFLSSSAGALAAKRATTTIPIVFSIGDDPITLGIVASLNRPGGNLTGIYQFTTGLEAKRLSALHEAVPRATSIAVLLNSTFTAAQAQLHDIQEAAQKLNVRLVILRANVESDLEVAFAGLSKSDAGALLVCGSPFFNTRRQQLVVLAARYKVPAIYEWRDFPEAGGLMSYGTDLAEAYRQAGIYAGRILRGAKAADLPVVQSTKFELVLNLSTAKALAFDFPATFLARADEVIE